jgi:hypothetical protein
MARMDDSERQSYPKSARGDGENDSKDFSPRSGDSQRARGGGSGDGTGPTCSPRSYPKGTKVNMDGGRMNPQKCESSSTGLYVDGVGRDD